MTNSLIQILLKVPQTARYISQAQHKVTAFLQHRPTPWGVALDTRDPRSLQVPDSLTVQPHCTASTRFDFMHPCFCWSMSILAILSSNFVDDAFLLLRLIDICSAMPCLINRSCSVISAPLSDGAVLLAACRVSHMADPHNNNVHYCPSDVKQI